MTNDRSETAPPGFASTAHRTVCQWEGAAAQIQHTGPRWTSIIAADRDSGGPEAAWSTQVLSRSYRDAIRRLCRSFLHLKERERRGRLSSVCTQVLSGVDPAAGTMVCAVKWRSCGCKLTCYSLGQPKGESCAYVKRKVGLLKPLIPFSPAARALLSSGDLVAALPKADLYALKGNIPLVKH